jgi:hypothetical protein
MNNRNAYRGLVLATAASLAACGGNDDKSCDAVAQTGCDDGQACELVTGGDPACFAPLLVRGKVSDLADGSAVAGARVEPLDEDGAPVGTVVTSAADGSYELRIPATRAADGSFAAAHVTLRADAAGFQTFPSGIREALPIDTGTAVDTDGKLVIQSALTDVGLLALGADAGSASLAGTIALPAAGAGVLVVAESGAHGYTAVADSHGDFTIFNLPAGDYAVSAYALGASWAPASVTLAAAQTGHVDLALDSRALGQVDGTVQMVDPQGATATSVLLVVESTFDETLARGSAPPGMRVANVSGTYSFTGVPEGRYVVLAAFENDGLVRDPDLSIGGTSILHIQVAAGATTTVDGFKITGALAILSPGADAPEAVTGAPMLSWKDDSSEDEYDVVVFDAFGQAIWQTTLPGASGHDPSVAYGGPALEPGMYYQFRVTSLKNSVPISRSEDLRGVFYVAAAP